MHIQLNNALALISLAITIRQVKSVSAKQYKKGNRIGRTHK